MKYYGYVFSNDPEWLEKNKDLLHQSKQPEPVKEPEPPLTLEEQVAKLTQENQELKVKLTQNKSNNQFWELDDLWQNWRTWWR